jgi:arabinofuranan 3-O-arabinosyltransferase
VLPLGLAYGVWVAGAVGAALVAVILVCMWWLGRRAPRRLRHAKPGRPSMGGRTLPLLAGPWPVAVSLALAGLAMGAGTYLALYMPFHEVTEVFGGALRGSVSQLLCLPALARLVLALGQPGDGEDADADPPSVRARAAAAAGGAVVVGANGAAGAHAAPDRYGSDGAEASGTNGATESSATPVSDEADGASRNGGSSDDDRWENDPEEART